MRYPNAMLRVRKGDVIVAASSCRRGFAVRPALVLVGLDRLAQLDVLGAAVKLVGPGHEQRVHLAHGGEMATRLGRAGACLRSKKLAPELAPDCKRRAGTEHGEIAQIRRVLLEKSGLLGFEDDGWGRGIPAFKTGALNHSATHPSQ
jgi:hypothetical protein